MGRLCSGSKLQKPFIKHYFQSLCDLQKLPYETHILCNKLFEHCWLLYANVLMQVRTFFKYDISHYIHRRGFRVAPRFSLIIYTVWAPGFNIFRIRAWYICTTLGPNWILMLKTKVWISNADHMGWIIHIHPQWYKMLSLLIMSHSLACSAW